MKKIMLIFAERFRDMDKGHITVLPNDSHKNLKMQKVDTFCQGEFVNYGYIKRRDMEKWYKGENVAVKMGMLSPFKKTYIGLNIVSAALKRISEQDTTALFEEDDELVPVYVFVQKETDNQWREYLAKKGYKSARANREGIVISKEKLFGEYGIHYGIETKEAKTLLEEKALAEEKRLKEIEKEKKAKLRQIANEYEKRNPGRKYEKDKKIQEALLISLKSQNPNKNYSIDNNFVITEYWYEKRIDEEKMTKELNTNTRVLWTLYALFIILPILGLWWAFLIDDVILVFYHKYCSKKLKWVEENRSKIDRKEKFYKPTA